MRCQQLRSPERCAKDFCSRTAILSVAERGSNPTLLQSYTPPCRCISASEQTAWQVGRLRGRSACCKVAMLVKQGHNQSVVALLLSHHPVRTCARFDGGQRSEDRLRAAVGLEHHVWQQPVAQQLQGTTTLHQTHASRASVCINVHPAKRRAGNRSPFRSTGSRSHVIGPVSLLFAQSWCPHMQTVPRQRSLTLGGVLLRFVTKTR